MKRALNFTQRKKQSGQIIIENILLMVVLLGVASSVVSALKEYGVATAFTQGPWARLNGMIQCGAWQPCGVETPSTNHPNAQNRVLTLDPKVAN